MAGGYDAAWRRGGVAATYYCFLSRGLVMVTVTPTNLQKMEFDVTTAEGPSRVTVVTGVIPGGLEVSAGNNFSTQSINLTALLDPTLTPGQFRKATATAALATTSAHA